MLKIAINFICKNESHVINRMLESARPVIDLIIAVDTGSSDNTISLIQEFGRRYAIPTFTFQRPFDNFAASRNHALSNLYETVANLGWDVMNTYGFSIDCDEVLCLSEDFKKEDLTKDIYYATVTGDMGSFSRQLFIKLSKTFWWEGPIHEILVWDEDTITRGFVTRLQIYYRSEGASWKGNLEAKFMNYVKLLEEYISAGHDDFRWHFYTGQSYVLASDHCKDKKRKTSLLHSAQGSFEKAMAIGAPSADETILLLKHMADNKHEIGEKWSAIKPALLSAYTLGPERAEALTKIIGHYMSKGDWEIAYIYSSFSLKAHHGNNPYRSGVLEVEDRLYQWKILLHHFVICHNSGRKTEADLVYKDFKQIIDTIRPTLSYKDLLFIQSNSRFLLSFRKMFGSQKKNRSYI